MWEWTWCFCTQFKLSITYQCIVFFTCHEVIQWVIADAPELPPFTHKSQASSPFDGVEFPLAYISVGRSVCSHAYKSPSMKAHIYSGHLIMSRVVEDSHSGFPNGRSWKNKTRNLILTTSIAAGDNKTCLDCNSQSHHLLEEKYLYCQPIICGDYLFFKCQNHQLQQLSSQDQESPLNAL